MFNMGTDLKCTYFGECKNKLLKIVAAKFVCKFPNISLGFL